MCQYPSPVFVEVIKSKAKSGKVYETWLVRESIRTHAGPRSRTVCNITSLPPAIRQLVASSLKGLSLVMPESAVLHNALDFGGLAVLRDAWSRFGLQEFFSGIAPVHASRLQAMIFSRLLFPCAKLAVAGQARGTALAAAELTQKVCLHVKGKIQSFQKYEINHKKYSKR